MASSVVAAAGIGAVGSILGAREQSSGTSSASGAAAAAEKRAMKLYTPWREAGERALPGLEELAKGEPSKYLPYLEHYVTGEGKPFDITTSPMYKYQLEKGTEQIGKSLAARGGYASGAGIQAEADFAQKLGAEESGRMYGRLMDLYNIGERGGAERYGRTLDIARLGAGAAGGAAAAAGTAGGQQVDIAMQRGAAGAGMYSNLANIGMAGVGAYQQQQGYQDIQRRMGDIEYFGAGGYGPAQKPLY